MIKNLVGIMKKIIRKENIWYIIAFLIISVIGLCLMIFFHVFNRGGNSVYVLYANGVEVASSAERHNLEEAIRISRIKIGNELDTMFLADVDFTIEESPVSYWFEKSSRLIAEQVENVLRDYQKDTLNHSYTVKINEHITHLATSQEVLGLLYESLEPYDTERLYQISLELDSGSELSALTAQIVSVDEEEPMFAAAGIARYLDQAEDSMEFSLELEFSDYELGLKDIYFQNSVKVVEAYLLESQLTEVSVAVDAVTKKLEKETIYEVASGDTLSAISMMNNIPVDRIIDLNTGLVDENSIIRIGDELIITVPEPELAVIHTSRNYYREEYEESVIYIDNDSWYTTTQVTLQQPSTGYREIVVDEVFRNDTLVEREILKEDVVMEAIPKIVERGTKIPPTYIKPLSGGTSSSGFGYRTAPTAGASTFHKGHDWATPTGTTIMASSAGVVSKAGWGSGYGYVIYINHADGKQTRYAHLSRILVNVGETVQQGQKIALSGNTGVSSGPHLHFEILINGVQVNPLYYLN